MGSNPKLSPIFSATFKAQKTFSLYFSGSTVIDLNKYAKKAQNIFIDTIITVQWIILF